jgi:lysozyme family protein
LINNFHACLAFVLKWEGGNDDDPQDPGGRTSRGITQREYNAWCALHKLPEADVWACKQSTIEEIYHAAYWSPHCDSLPVGLDLMFFDCAVNEGPHEAIVFLQRALGVTADGHFGLVTAAAVAKVSSERLIRQIYAERQAHYRSLRTFRRFGKGWLNRLSACLKTSLEMAQI